MMSNKRNYIKGRSRSSGTTDMELFVKMLRAASLQVQSCNYSTVHILIVINYHPNKPEKKYFKDIEKALNI